MPAPDAMTCDQLAKMIGIPKAPTVLDICRPVLRGADPRLIATARALPALDRLATLVRDADNDRPDRSPDAKGARG